MSRIRLLGSLLASSRHRICARSASVLHHRLPMGESYRSLVTVGALSLFGAGMWYLKDVPQEPTGRKRIHQEVVWVEETAEEKAMKKRFEDWMIKFGRRYRDKEEKAMRYELFKQSAQRVDWYNATSTGCTFATNDFSDRTSEELQLRCGGCRGL